MLKINKKTIICCGCAVTLLSLATIGVYNSVNGDGNKQEVTNINTSNVDTLNVKTFSYEFNNHKYIRFTSENESWCVHDPDCPCQNEMLRKKLNNITTVITNDTRKMLNNVETRVNKKINDQNARLSNIEKKVQPRTIVKTRTITIYKRKK